MHTVSHGRLGNGLRLVTVHRPHLHRVVVSAYIHVGSRHESLATNGLSHFIEHMLFRGTARWPTAAAFNHGIESLGGDLTAATHGDFTLFELTVPPDAIVEGCAELGEVFTLPVFSDAAIEKGIVREEILEDLDEDGRDVHPDNLSRRQVFGRHPLGFPITGRVSNVDKFSHRHLREHLSRYYVARNMAVVIVGPGTHRAMSRAIEKSFSGLSAGDPSVNRAFTATQSRARIKVVPNVGSQTSVRLAFPTPGQRAPSARAIDLLLRVLDDGMSTRLHRRICDERGLAYEVNASVELFDDAGVFDVAASVAHGSVPSLVGEVLNIFGDLALDGPTREEVEKAKRRSAFDLDALEDDAHALADFYGTSELFNLRQTPTERRQRILGLTVGDLRRVARAVFTSHRLNLALVGQLTPGAHAEVNGLVRRFRERLAAGVRTRGPTTLSGFTRPGIARSVDRPTALDLAAALP